jgi:peptidoglycan DL-endopeptidase CwlO
LASQFAERKWNFQSFRELQRSTRMAGTLQYAAVSNPLREKSVHRTTPVLSAALVIGAVASPLAPAMAQQSDLSVSPFVSFLPTMGSNPLAGLALTLAGNGGFGIRASGNVSLENTNRSSSLSLSNSGTRPWGADADAILSIGGRAFGGNRSFAPFVFAGVGTAAKDSGGLRVQRNNWSYGVGASLPLAGAVDIFGESRWRMSRYVLPTSSMAPSPTQEFRVGVSLHVGGLNSRARSAPSRRAEGSKPVPTGRYPGSISTSSVTAARVLNTADDYVGVRYVYGGTSPVTGFDCSGFVQYVFGKHGVALPRTSRQQAQVGTALAPDWRAVTAGDLVMFSEGGPISHVAIYAGSNRIIHSSSSGGGVRFDDLSTQRGEWFVDHMVAARRVTPNARGLLLDLARGFATSGLQLDAPDHAPRVARDKDD